MDERVKLLREIIKQLRTVNISVLREVCAYLRYR